MSVRDSVYQYVPAVRVGACQCVSAVLVPLVSIPCSCLELSELDATVCFCEAHPNLPCASFVCGGVLPTVVASVQ